MDTSEKASGLSLLSTPEIRSIWGTFYCDFLKRSLDVTICLLILPFVLPVLLILMLLVKCDSPGPSIFRGVRIGKDGKKFHILKLRTMVTNAKEKLETILKENEALRIEWEQDQKLKCDPRITRLGGIIRRLSLDELPQIINVLKGEMSLVGPRPIVEEEIPKYGNTFREYKRVLPGVTGYWQVNGRNDLSYPERVAMDSQYIDNLSLGLDMRILFKTLPAAIAKSGAY